MAVSRALGLIVVAILVVRSSSAAQQSGSAQPAPCTAAAHGEFDFWLGEWDVKTPNGVVAGRNSISKILGGCVILESWAGVSGVRGQSFNIFDASRRRWHQTWVDSQGTLLLLEGGLTAPGKMVMEGTTTTPKGPVQQRISWTAQGQQLRQVWETREHGGAWTVVFDGLYSPAGEAGSQTAEASLRALEAEYVAAWVANDSSRVLATLAPDAVIMPGRLAPISGRTAIKDFWFPPTATMTRVIAYKTHIDEIEVSGDLAYVRGRGDLSFEWQEPDKPVQRQRNRSVFTMIARRQPDGGWKMTRRMWSDLAG